MTKEYILITGVAGLLGSRMADWIIENKSDQFAVVGIDNLFGGYIENVHPDVIFYQEELATANLKQIFDKYNFKYVFHFAAYAAEGLSPFMRKFNYSNNVLSTVNIVNECIMHDVKRLVYTSSMGVYGHSINNNRFDENDEWHPIDPYGISKYACEMDIEIAGEQHGLDWCIIRPHNVYGVKQNIWDKYRNVLGIWMVNILKNEPMLIYGDGEQQRAFTEMSDILIPLWNAATFPSASKQIINLGGINAYTINESAKILCDITGYNNVEYKEPRHEVKLAVPTYQKSIDILEFEHRTDLREGLENMWEWAKQQPKRPQYKWDNYEITKNIYSYWK